MKSTYSGMQSNTSKSVANNSSYRRFIFRIAGVLAAEEKGMNNILVGEVFELQRFKLPKFDCTVSLVNYQVARKLRVGLLNVAE